MIDFGKKLKEAKVAKALRPEEIYDSLDRTTEAGPLREVQKNILEEWYEHYRDKKDLIIKLHTGEGKTLIGLLILQSILNQKAGPSIYICPTKNLAAQVMKEAKKFGIPFCTITDSYLPVEYENGDKILITYVHKVFNGRTIFGRRGQTIAFGCCILDDSHACIESIQANFTLKIPRKSDAYNELKLLFRESLQQQGEGSYLDLNNDKSGTVMPIPYWAWLDKQHELISILSKYVDDEEWIKFAWPLIKDDLSHCNAYISSEVIEIVPNYIPIEKFSFFDKANHRILMSATTQNDEFFIKGLHFSIDTIQHPLFDPNRLWSGEKMILIPSLIDEKLGRNVMVAYLGRSNVKRIYGRVAITPSYQMAHDYTNFGAIVAHSENINENIADLRRGKCANVLVLANRYDGIDLPDDACRILILDSLPVCDSLADRYELQCRENSELLNLKIAQRIEQGMGRSVRGEKDYSAIFLIGTDLVKFVMSKRTASYFSPQTQKQIEIGLDIAKDAKEDVKEGEEYKQIYDLLRLFITRDENWKEYYKQSMDDIVVKSKTRNYDSINYEFLAAKASYSNNNDKACDYIRKILQNVADESERGWYMQLLAYYTYFDSRENSIKIQKTAYENNTNLLKPEIGITYKKLINKSASQLEAVLKVLHKYGSYQELRLYYDDVLNNFSFGMVANKFEQAVKDIGLLLGFESQRPDSEIRKGPDNLWRGVKDTYFLIECKSEVNLARVAISKDEAGQMNNHCGWFESEYGKGHNVKRILIIPTNVLAKNADFTHEIHIMTDECLTQFKNNFSKFIHEFKGYDLKDMTTDKIHSFLVANRLTIEDLKKYYTVHVVREK